MLGCRTTADSLRAIPREDYPSPQAKPEEVFAFFQRATRVDDPAAAYSCLGQNIQSEISLGRFVDGWTLLDRYIQAFGSASVVRAHDVREGRLLVIGLAGLEEPFLWVREASGWRLALPSPYNTRSLPELFDALKNTDLAVLMPRPRPMRRAG
jgi:hypothetical protein